MKLKLKSKVGENRYIFSGRVENKLEVEKYIRRTEGVERYGELCHQTDPSCLGPSIIKLSHSIEDVKLLDDENVQIELLTKNTPNGETVASLLESDATKDLVRLVPRGFGDKILTFDFVMDVKPQEP